MAIKGLTTLVVSERTVESGADKYAGGTIAGKMVSYSSEITTNDEQVLYCDNEICERAGGDFKEGTLTISTCDLDDEATALFLNVKENTATIGTDKTVKEIIYDDETKGVNLGVGLIELHQEENVDYWKAVWFPNVTFNIPAGSAETKGETVSWQTPSITGKISRGASYDDETGYHPWKVTAKCTSKADALAYLMYKANNDTIPSQG